MTRADEAALRARIVATCREMNARGLNHGTSGNVSARFGERVLITPSGVPYGVMLPEDVVALGTDGRPEGGLEPSSEWRMHLAIYAAHDEAHAVVHVHSDHAVALSCLREDVPAFHYMMAEFGGHDLRCADYATFGSEELAEAMIAALDGRNACLLANHGQICFAATLEEALRGADAVETLCRQYAIAKAAGAPVVLGDSEMAEVTERFTTYGQKKR